MGSIAGTRVNPETGKALNPEQQGLLDSQNASDEYEGMSPLAMGLLQAGASMMRSGGWRNTPMTTGEAIGHAIPAGITGYYNQDIMNQQGEAEFYERQQAEEQARIQKEQLLNKQGLEQEEMTRMLLAVDNLDIKNNRKTYLKGLIRRGGKDAQIAFEEINTILTKEEAFKAEKPYLLKGVGTVYKNHKGDIIKLADEKKSYGDIKFGTYGLKNLNAMKLMEDQGLTPPENAKDILIEPIAVSGDVVGIKTQWLDDDGNPIEKTKSEKENAKYEYIDVKDEEKKKAFSARFANMKVPEDATEMVVNQYGKVEAYRTRDDKTYNLGIDYQKRAIDEDKLLKTKNLDVAGYKALFPNLGVPVGTDRVVVDKDNNITFFDKDGVKVKGQSLSRVNLVDQFNGTSDIYSYHVDDKTGKIINTIGKVTDVKTPVERLRYNQDRADKLVKDRNLNAMIDALGNDYGVDKRTLAFYRKGVAGDYDKTFSKVTDHYGDFVNLDEAVVTGDILNKRSIKAGGKGDVYDSTLSYAKKAGVWEQYTPSSDWIVSGETGLRKEFNRITDDYRVASRGHDGVMEGLDSDNGFGDIMAITSFRIMFEPNSVVREAEFEITSQAGGWFQTLMNKPHQYMVGDRLRPDVREKMRALVVRYMKSREDYVDRHYNDFRAIAQKNFKSNAGIEHPFKSYKWSKHYDKNVKVGVGSSDADKQKNLDQLGLAPE
jgi:hypothetical protein